MNGNTGHIADHDLTPEEVEAVLRNPNSRDGWSRSSGRPMVTGHTGTGRHVAVIYRIKQIRSGVTIRPITAYDVDPY